MKKLIIKPIMTEKTLNLADKLNQYTFLVTAQVGKVEVGRAVAKKFEVKVKKVRILNTLGKKVRFGKKRVAGQRQNLKKAVVTLEAGESIPIFEIK